MPVIDHWWQTETGWAIAANCMGIEPLPVKPGSPTRAVPGYDVQVLDEAGRGRCGPGRDRRDLRRAAVAAGLHADAVERRRALRRVVPLRSIPGYYLTADAGYLDEDGYLYVMGRIDDVINIAGHRLSTGAMEEVLAAHPDVAECAVVGVADELKGQVPVGLRRAEGGRRRDEDDDRGRAASRWSATGSAPVAAFKQARVVRALPKTRSGKILRGDDARDRRRRGVAACPPPSRTRPCSTTSRRCRTSRM